MSILDFITKYGTDTPQLLIAEFIRRSPEFKGDNELAKSIGTMMGDLQLALTCHANQPQ